MEVKRIDPLYCALSASGVLAIATKSAGIQFLRASVEELADHKQQFRRTAYFFESSDTLVLEIQWSLNTSQTGLLAVLTPQRLYIINEQADLHNVIDGEYTAISWTNRGLLHVTKDNQMFLNGTNIGEGLQTRSFIRKLCLKSESEVIAIMSDNSIYSIHLETLNSEMIHQPSTRYIYDACFVNNNLFVYNSTHLNDQPLAPIRGHLVSAPEPGIVYANTQMVNLPNLELKSKLDKKDEVLCVCTHPTLGWGCLVSQPVQTGTWKYPIQSWLSVNIHWFTFSRLESTNSVPMPALWLYYRLQNSLPQPLGPEPQPPKIADLDSTNFESKLKDLFTSEWFKFKQIEWFISPVSRQVIEQQMRAEVSGLVTLEKPNGHLDEIVYALYTNKSIKFRVQGLGISDEFTGGVALSGRKWSLCTMTLLPLMTMDVQNSADEKFSKYKNLPNIELLESGGGSSSGNNQLTTALLNASEHCFITGCKWI